MLALSVCTSPAWAFLDPPYITPTNPKAGDAISVNIYGGQCDLVHDGITWPPPVTQQESEITILFTGIHEGDPEWCYYNIGTSTYPLGKFPPGTYTLDVERRYMTVFGEWMQETLGIIPFTVAGAPSKPPAEAPASSRTSLVALLVALTGMAWFGLRRRSRQLR
jgi:hypothetical protein